MDLEDIRSSSAPGVGKAEHWATALSREGQKVFDRALPNEEGRLREVYQRLQANGQVLVVVDQPATIGALAVAVAQDMGITVGYLPGLSMRRIADLTPGSAKTDAKDAAVIAGAARSMPHTLRAISTSDEDAAALSMLTGFDLDLACQVNQTKGRIRGQSFTQNHPALESVVGFLAGHTTPPLEARRRLAYPSRPETRRQDKDRRQAQEARVQAARHLGRPDRLGPGAPDRGGRRHRRRRNGATPPGQAAHLPAHSAGRCRRSGRGPWWRPTLMCQVLTTRARDQGSRPPPSLLAETLGKTSRHRRPAGLLHRARSRHTPLRLIDPWRARLPRRQQEAQARHVPLRLRLPALRPRLPGLLPAQTRPRQTALGQAVLALTHRRILTLHAMIRDGALCDPQPSTQLPAA